MKVDLSKPKKVAFYCRVAREDDEAIGKQADILRTYAKEHSYNDRALYVDNGVSGIGFDRPALNRLKKTHKRRAYRHGHGYGFIPRQQEPV